MTTILFDVMYEDTMSGGDYHIYFTNKKAADDYVVETTKDNHFFSAKVEPIAAHDSIEDLVAYNTAAKLTVDELAALKAHWLEEVGLNPNEHP